MNFKVKIYFSIEEENSSNKKSGVSIKFRSGLKKQCLSEYLDILAIKIKYILT